MHPSNQNLKLTAKKQHSYNDFCSSKDENDGISWKSILKESKDSETNY
jgi:hypothetical protein